MSNGNSFKKKMSVPHHILPGTEIWGEQPKDRYHESKYMWEILVCPWNITVTLISTKLTFKKYSHLTLLAPTNLITMWYHYDFFIKTATEQVSLLMHIFIYLFIHSTNTHWVPGMFMVWWIRWWMSKIHIPMEHIFQCRGKQQTSGSIFEEVVNAMKKNVAG